MEMIGDKKDFKRIRTVITKFEKELNALTIRVDEISSFVDKMEYRLYEDISSEDRKDIGDYI